MTVSSTAAYSGPFTGNGATTVFPFTFDAGTADEVAVYEDGQVVTTGFTVTLNAGGNGGNVTYDSPLTNGVELLIVSDPDFAQDVALVNNGAFLAEVVEGAFDQAARRDIHLQGQLDRAVLAAPGASGVVIEEGSDGVLGITEDGGVEVLPLADFRGEAGPAGDMSVNYKVKTPLMFGAVPYDPSLEIDVTDELQAFFDDAADADNARAYIYDWSGEWLVSDTIYANYSNTNDDVPGPKFICGALRVAPITSLPGGIALEVALEIAGFEQDWRGTIGIFPSGALKWGANTTYTDRRYKTGVRIRSSNGSTFGDFAVYDAMRNCVWVDSEGNPFTLRAGTAREVTYGSSNCIGTDLGNINGRTFGSQHKSSAKYGFTTTIVSKTHGTNSGSGFSAGGGGNSNFQRTQLVVGSTANMEVNDIGRFRHEVAAAVFGTIAFDATAKTITWSAGDPVAQGMAVGDIYYVENTDASTVNEAIRFRIVSFGGVSNRTITVAAMDTGFTTQAARADLILASAWDYAAIKEITDATTMEVFPFVPERINTVWRHVCGFALRIDGGDAAWITVQSVNSLLGAGTLMLFDCLYGPKIAGSIGMDFGEVGVRIASTAPTSSSLGLRFSSAHLEAATWPLLINTVGFTGEVGGSSAFHLHGVHVDGPRTASTDLARGSGTLVNGTFNTADQFVHAQYQTRFEGTHGSGAAVYTGDTAYYLSNDTRYRERFIHTDTATLEVRYNYDLAKKFACHHWARLVWTDSDGSGPDGTLTVNLTQWLIDDGWTFSGAFAGTSDTIVTPGASVMLYFCFLQSVKKVAVVQLDGTP